MSLVWRLWQLCAQTFRWYPKRSLVAILLLTGVAVADALSVVSLIPAIEYLSRANEVSSFSVKLNSWLEAQGIARNLVTYFAVCALTILLKSLLRAISKRILISIQMDFEVKLASDAVQTLLLANYRSIEGLEKGDLLNLITLEVQKVGECLFYIYDYLALVLKFLFYFSVLLAFSVPLVAAIVFTSVLTLGPSLLLSKLIYRSSQSRMAHSGLVTDYLSQLIGSVLEIKSYSAERFFSSHFLGRLRSFKAEHGRLLLLQDLTGVILEPFGILQIIVVVYLALNHFSLTFPETLVVLFTLRNLLPLFGQMMTYKQVLISSIPSFEGVNNLIKTMDKVTENHSGSVLSEFSAKVELRDVSYSYGTKQVLERVNLVVPKGIAIAIVGPSGAGKSTLVKTILGFLPPSSGEVVIDDHRLAEVSISSWRRMVGFVPQDPILLKESLRQNIAVGESEVDEQRLRQAIRRAHLDEMVAKLPQGLDTVLGLKGEGLSSGQRQRIALARALYRDPPVIILDEPTSALDATSEAFIKQTIESMKGEKTFVIIAHRLSTIRFCDVIHVLADGKIVESGSYDQLIARAGFFSRLVNTQG